MFVVFSKYPVVLLRSIVLLYTTMNQEVYTNFKLTNFNTKAEMQRKYLIFYTSQNYV